MKQATYVVDKLRNYSDFGIMFLIWVITEPLKSTINWISHIFAIDKSSKNIAWLVSNVEHYIFFPSYYVFNWVVHHSGLGSIFFTRIKSSQRFSPIPDVKQKWE